MIISEPASLPPYEFAGNLWNGGGRMSSTFFKKKVLIMKRKIVDKFELAVLVSIFISSVYAISPVV